ncbi:hypothetical protein [Larkinella harenae]
MSKKIKKWLRRLGRLPDAAKVQLISSFVNAIRFGWDIIRFTGTARYSL